MPVDPQIQAIIDLTAELAPMHTLSVAEARERMAARDVPGLRIPPVADVADRTIRGPGGELGLRIYTPPGAGPFPLLVFFHGSGFVVCSLDTHDVMCRNLCAGAGCVVVSVDYRLAPEHKFPAAPEDCLFATRWAAENAAALNADPGRVAVGGDSAGANLAAVTALRVRDEGGPAFCAQLLIYPVTDYHSPGTPSYEENAEGYGLTRNSMEWFWSHYLADQLHASHPHAAPMRAHDLRGLPPALVVTAEYDPLRDEGEAYGEKLRQAGVPTEIVRWDGMNHGFFFWVGVIDKAGVAMDGACEWLRGRFGNVR
ncbi:MAG: alpha/beta hydrolase [Acetobacteraceae bacterium]|nr:alpha/beta hydrolase [Acetobacteraceae bacterium]